jgi:hypothetical protein
MQDSVDIQRVSSISYNERPIIATTSIATSEE